MGKSFSPNLYLFIECELWKSNQWIAYSYYILYACKISKKLKINSYIINDMFKFQLFVVKNYAQKEAY